MDDRRPVEPRRRSRSAARPRRRALLAEVERRFGCEAICGYGLTEASPQLTKSLDKPGEPPLGGAAGHDRVCRSSASTSACSTTPASRCRGTASTTGEICVRSNHVMAGYWQRPEETAAALAGGWLHTEDIAVVDPDGYVTIVDRKKDLIISGGENISSVEVEKTLAEHPAVLEVAVVGMPDERWGEVPQAWVVARAGHEPDGGRADRLRARPPRPLQGAQGRASSSPTSRRAAPARSRSASCATARTPPSF